MGILILMISIIWFVAGLVTGLALGAIIQRAERVRTDDYLSCVFASLETIQAFRN
jgi:NhaP-type Na+/H+ or K+/H+ antiporter